MKMIEGVPARSPLGRALAARQKAFDARRLAETQKQLDASWQAAARSSGGEFVDEHGVDYLLSDTAAPGKQVLQDCPNCSGSVDMSALKIGGKGSCPHCDGPLTRGNPDALPDNSGELAEDALDDSLPSDTPSDSAALEGLDIRTKTTPRSMPSRDANGAPASLRDADRYFSASERKQMGRLLDEILQRRRGTTPLL